MWQSTRPQKRKANCSSDRPGSVLEGEMNAWNLQKRGLQILQSICCVNIHVQLALGGQLKRCLGLSPSCFK